MGLAGFGVVLATAWLAERTTLIAINPFEPISDALVAHPFVVVGVLALTAATIWAVPRWRVAPEDQQSTAAMS